VGIRVNAILPGIIDTPMTVAALAARGEGIVDEIPLRTIGQPGDVAELTLFLASDSARFITGADYVIDGGSTA
jgi:NAD(P)-dependent dehydrogenase (short-subunit alcohol dehydrogenase family)